MADRPDDDSGVGMASINEPIMMLNEETIGPDESDLIKTETNRTRCRKLKNPKRGIQFMSMNEIRVASPERDSLMDTPPNSTSDTGSDSYTEMSPTESPSGFSPLEESSDSYKSLSPFARLKLKRKMENSYFKPILHTSDDRVPGSSFPGMVCESGHSAFRNVNSNDSSQSGCNNNKNTVNLIKLHQIKSAFTLSEDRDIPSAAVSLGHMFALKKRIIKREALNEELNGGEGSGSDGLSEPSFDGDSPQNIKEETIESDNEEHRLKVNKISRVF